MLVFVVLLSYVMGAAMSFCSFYACGSLTATSFTIVGNSSKLLSALIN